MTVYDYSFARPDPALLDEGVMRYLSIDMDSTHGKILFPAELDALHQANKRVGLVWEVNANDGGGGHDQGVEYGQRARTAANALGFPAEVPLYWAIDRRLNDVGRLQAVDYGQGFTEAAGKARPYGEAALVDAAVAAGIADCGWSPETWGDSNNLALQQVVNPDPNIVLIAGTDANRVKRPDWGGWHPDYPLTAFAQQEDEVTPEDFESYLKLSYYEGRDGFSTLHNMAADITSTVIGTLLAHDGAMGGLSDTTIAAVAKACADEQARRLAASH